MDYIITPLRIYYVVNAHVNVAIAHINWAIFICNGVIYITFAERIYS